MGLQSEIGEALTYYIDQYFSGSQNESCPPHSRYSRGPNLLAAVDRFSRAEIVYFVQVNENSKRCNPTQVVALSLRKVDWMQDNAPSL